MEYSALTALDKFDVRANYLRGTVPNWVARLKSWCVLTNSQRCKLPSANGGNPEACGVADTNVFDCPRFDLGNNYQFGESTCGADLINCRHTLASTAWNRGQPWSPRPLGAENRYAAAQRREAWANHRYEQAMEYAAKAKARQEAQHPARQGGAE